MRHQRQQPSFLASLGQAFHFHHNSPKHASLFNVQRCDPRAKKHELLAAERLVYLQTSLQQHVSLHWLYQALVLVTYTVSGTQEMIPALVYPLPESDELWVSKYLEDTCRLLDVLNTVRKLVAELEDKHMLVKLALSTLNSKTGASEERLAKVRRTLSDYNQVGKSSGNKIKVEECMRMLLEMIQQPFEESFSPREGGRGFLSALYGAKVVAVYVMGVVVTVFGGSSAGKAYNVIDCPVPDCFAWSRPLQGLVLQVKRIALTGPGASSSTVIKELNVLDTQVESWLCRLQTPAAAKEVNEIADDKLQEAGVGEISSEEDDAGDKLQEALKSSEEGVELVRGEIDKLFHVVVCNRNLLLGHLRR